MTRTRALAIAAAVTTALTFLPFHLALAGAVQVLAPVTEADGRLGLCEVLAGNPAGGAGPSWAQLAYNAGARLNRWEFRWDRLEQQQNVWDFTADDAAVQSSRQAGLDVLGILIGTPDWAAAPGQKPGNGLPTGLNLKYTNTDNLWADYVRETVLHYAGQVRFWEVWNEPDLSYFWSGSPDDYYRLLKVAYLTIKDADPQARVLIAGMVVPDLAFLTHVLDDARADPSAQAYHGYFDIAAWHGYGPAKDLYTNIGRIGDLLSREGFGNVPLWVTEDGFPSANPNGEPRQAAYVFETAAYALAAGASRFLVYRQSDDPVPKNWGIMTSAGQPRMAYVAFQMAARYLAHAGAIAYAPLPGLERFTFYEPNRRVTVLWTTGLADQAATLFADARGASVVNWTGASASPAVAGGTIRLTAPGAAFNTGIDPQGSVVGGPTLVVTQDNTPHGPLPSNLYLAPPVSLSQAMPGDQRHLVVFNPGNAGVWAQVSSLDNPNERAMVQVGPRSLQRVDLDLLAGADYGGMYLVSSSAPLVAEAASTETAVPAVGAAADWYAPSAAWNRLAGRSPLTLLDASGKPVSAKIEAFGSKGVIRARAVLQLTPATPQSWSLPEELQGMQLSLTVHAAGPVAVSGANAVTRASTAWYAVRPQAPLSLFNPATRTVAQVRVQYVGGGARRALRLRLSPHHSLTVPSRGARAVVLSATHDLVVGSVKPASRRARQAPGGALLTSQPGERAALTVAGPTTSVALFNPSHRAAHVTLSLVGVTKTSEVRRAIPPSGLVTMRVRSAASAARGVIVTSDVPVVAGPAS